jgi:hypothetical protein
LTAFYGLNGFDGLNGLNCFNGLSGFLGLNGLYSLNCLNGFLGLNGSIKETEVLCHYSTGQGIRGWMGGLQVSAEK